MEVIRDIVSLPWLTLLGIFFMLGITGLFVIYLALHHLAPKPRLPFPSEKTYKTTTPDGSIVTRQLPCWYDAWLSERHVSESHQPELGRFHVPDHGTIEAPQVRVSVVMPAYNEEARILPALDEAVAYLDATFGRPGQDKNRKYTGPGAGGAARRTGGPPLDLNGYEIIIINDGSKDRTVEVALAFSRERELHDIIRVVTLEKNRGKGGGVTHGLRHVRGEYALFADADGASRFCDLGKLIEGVEEVVDGSHRGIAVGSRSHLVGSEAVVKRSAIRNFLMHAFHLVLTILTPPATSRIKDTQCGFKLFSRAALPHVVPYMHAEGWHFDIEMLMLAESAPATPVRSSTGDVIGTTAGIRVAEVPIGWHEVDGSKMSLVSDSLRMAVGLAVLRASWMMGVYRRRLT